MSRVINWDFSRLSHNMLVSSYDFDEEHEYNLYICQQTISFKFFSWLSVLSNICSWYFLFLSRSFASLLNKKKEISLSSVINNNFPYFPPWPRSGSPHMHLVWCYMLLWPYVLSVGNLILYKPTGFIYIGSLIIHIAVFNLIHWASLRLFIAAKQIKNLTVWGTVTYVNCSYCRSF